MKKPKKCCPCGSYECQVPMPIKGRRQDIDFCIADIVTALNAANIPTVISCCGHKQLKGAPGIVNLEDGRSLQIYGKSGFCVPGGGGGGGRGGRLGVPGGSKSDRSG